MSLSLVIPAAVALVVLGGALVFLTFRYWKYRGTRLITCPENQRPAAVDVDAGFAAVTSLGGETALRLKDCSRWPERRHCGQSCLEQIEDAPEDCLVVNLLKGWYRDKSCAVCGKPFGEIHGWEHKPALMSSERKTLEWTEVAPENLPEVFASHYPVCWDCHIVESLYRQHPELVVERPAASETQAVSTPASRQARADNSS